MTERNFMNNVTWKIIAKLDAQSCYSAWGLKLCNIFTGERNRAFHVVFHVVICICSNYAIWYVRAFVQLIRLRIKYKTFKNHGANQTIFSYWSWGRYVSLADCYSNRNIKIIFLCAFKVPIWNAGYGSQKASYCPKMRQEVALV